MIQHWVARWDASIARWVSEGPTTDSHGRPRLDGCDAVREAYLGRDGAALDPAALPEPYVGDPLSEDLWAVIITLNPGRTAPSHQRYPDGEYVRRIASGAESYSDIFRRWRDVLPGTRKFWNRTSTFASRIIHDETTRSCEKVFGLDLVPWHSEHWGGLDMGVEGLTTWFRENVFNVARAVASSTRITEYARQRDSTALPVALAIGKQVREQLEDLGFDCLFTLSKTSATNPLISWPEAAPGKPHSRQIRWLESRDFGLAVLHTQLSSMQPPGESFTDLLRRIVREPDLRRRLAEG